MNDKKKLSFDVLRKIIFISVILIIILGIGVFASKNDVETIRIVYPDNHETTVITSKTKIKDILSENYIIIAEDESVYPKEEENIDFTKTITIHKIDSEVPVVAEEQKDVSTQEILGQYSTIVEKIITEQVEIPFETITKNVASSSDTTDTVIQQGENGIKEVKYKVKLQNDAEISREVISETVIKNPVNKIIKVSNKITSRYGSRMSASSSEYDIICAIVQQEGGSGYESALAVMSSAINRTRSSSWRRYGSTVYAQFTAPGQYCYSIDSYWVKYLNGNVSSAVKQAVNDGLAGKTNHSYTSFRSAGYASKSMRANGTVIGGNVYFGH